MSTLPTARWLIVATASIVITTACDHDEANGKSGERASPTGGMALGKYPRRSGPDLDCKDLGYAVRVDGPDPHFLDADHDGIGCERYLGRPVPDSARLR